MSSADPSISSGSSGSDGPSRTSRSPRATHGGRRVVITGLGPITASGIGADDFWSGLRKQRSPIRRITRFDAGPWRSKIAGEIDDFDPGRYMDPQVARRLDRYSQFAISATRLALEDASLDATSLDPDRVAVQLGSALGGVAHAERQVTNLMERGIRAVDPRVALHTFCGAASCNIAIEFGFSGPNSTNAMSCASGTLAIGEAARLIEDGRVDVAVAGGIEAPLSSLSFGAFALIRAMSTRNDDPARACRPFDRDRDGFIMGEAAAVLVLESLEHADARGATIYGEVAGFANTNDAHHMTAPRPDGAQATRAMEIAMEHAGVTPSDIDYVNAHASSTPLNDATETRAIKQALGTRAYEIPVSGTKPYYGHALGASGAVEATICALSLSRGWIPPTLNLEEPDDDCDLDYVPRDGREQFPDVCISNSFGFGGINGVLVLRGPG